MAGMGMSGEVRIEEEEMDEEEELAKIIEDTVKVDEFGDHVYDDVDETLRKAIESDNEAPAEEEEEKPARRRRKKKGA